MEVDEATGGGWRDWLGRVALSLLLGVLVGLLGYLVARAFTTGYLFYQQQQFVQETLGVLRADGVESLGQSNLRELRQLVTALEAQYRRLSVQIGFACGALGAAISYIMFERMAAAAQAPAKRRP